jgi:predicted nucleic acid-binding protein
MPVVVADTGPLNYLVQIDAIDVLPKLFGKIIIPAAVVDELVHPRAPAMVRAWAVSSPAWVEIRPNPVAAHDIAPSRTLEDGELAAITLAREIGSDLILMDDRDGVAFARSQGLAVTGTLGVLDLAARRGTDRSVESFRAAQNDDVSLSPGLARCPAFTPAGREETDED